MSAPAKIVHPLRLYRAILREHRHLPQQMKGIGDVYVKQEFDLHKGVKPGAQLDQFISGWNKYLQQMQKQRQVQGSFGVAMAEEDIKTKLSAEQQKKLDELREELKNLEH
jgi:hypothetical protein